MEEYSLEYPPCRFGLTFGRICLDHPIQRGWSRRCTRLTHFPFLSQGKYWQGRLTRAKPICEVLLHANVTQNQR